MSVIRGRRLTRWSSWARTRVWVSAAFTLVSLRLMLPPLSFRAKASMEMPFRSVSSSVTKYENDSTVGLLSPAA